MCCIDERSEQVLEICNTSGIHVPEEIAIIGVDNDEMICELSCPPLTSISFNAREIGYQAAKLLDSMMRGKKSAASYEIMTRPLSVVQRQSTEMTAVKDTEVAEAVSYIRGHAHQNITVDDVADHVAVPRRTLERRFRLKLKNTIYKEIESEKIAKIEKLLNETNLSIAAIAEKMGFSTPSEITRFFSRIRKMNPTEYRKLLGHYSDEKI
jgi:LacI family transcriptional regulator